MAEWTKDQIIARIRGEAQKQGVDPNLALAVAMQESELWPNATGDNGKSLGLFQLQPAAAIDVGVNPQFRQEPGVNIYGGVKYLGQKLQQSKGNVEQALRRYNGGGDPNYVQNVLRFFKPGVAEAAERPQAGTYSDTDVQNALTALGGSTTSQASAGGTYSDEDVQNAMKALSGTQTSTEAPRSPQAPPPVSQTPPPPSTPPRPQAPPPAPDTSWTPGMRLQALPSMRQLEPADRMQKTAMFAALAPALQEEFLRSEEPQAASLAVGGGKAGTPRPVTDPAALLAVGGGPTPAPPVVPRDPAARAAQIRTELAAWEQQQGRPWREGDPLMPTQQAAMAGATTEAPLEEGITKPSTMIPLLMPGTGLKAVAPALKQAAPLVQRAVRPVAEGLSQTLGWGTGRIATGEVPSAGEVGTELLWNVGTGGVLEGLHAGGQRLLRRSKGGQAILAADEATQTARAQWQAAVAEQQATAQTTRADLYANAVRKARASEAAYQRKLAARDEAIATNKQDYDEAVQTVQQERTATVRAEQEARYGTAREQTLAEGQQAQARQQQYQQAVTGQRQAVTQAQAIPGKYTPETPSWVLYEKFGEAAKDAVVDLSPAKAALAEVRASRGVLPDGTVRPFPQAVESIATNLEKATGIEGVTVQTIREELRRLGPLTRSEDSNIRGAAKQVYGIYADVLEASPVANDLLRQANATFRKEMAIQDVSEWLRPGHGIVRLDNQRREVINVGALMTRLEKQIGDDSLFRGSFTPDELQALRQDVGALAGTPNMPRGGPPTVPAPVQLPGGMQDLPATLQRPPTPPTQRPDPAMPQAAPRELLPGGAGGGPSRPALTQPPPVTPRQQLGERPRALGPRAGEWGAILTTLQAFGVPTAPLAAAGALKVTATQGRWLLANALLDPKRRALMQAAMDGQQRLNPRVYGALVATLSPQEKKAYERETKR